MGARSQPTVAQMFISELIGTFALTFFGAGSVISFPAVMGPGPAALFAIGATFGFIIAIMIYATGHISGTHINPSVTIGLLAVRRFPGKLVAPYIVAQCVGGILAGLCLYACYPVVGRKVHFGSTLPNYALGITDGAAVLIEILLTFWLLFVIMGTAVDKRAPPGWAGFAIGFTVACDIWVGGPLTGSSLNFARSLGPAIAAAIAGDFLPLAKLWIYLVGPIIGGVLGAVIYEYCFKPARS